MKTDIINQFGQAIDCKWQKIEILRMINKGIDSKKIGSNLVEITRSYRKEGMHEVTVNVERIPT